LGIGFTLAVHDLEIRGAGEILGEEQSGHIHEIGFSLYMELLERAVSTFRSGRHPQLDRPLDHGAEIDIHISALIPADYLPDVHTRLIMYKRIASARDSDELQVLSEEMTDRFGLIPEPVKNLFKIASLKVRINKLGVKKIDLGEKGGRIQFRADTIIEPGAVLGLIQKKPETYRFDGGEKLRIIGEFDTPEIRIAFLHDLFDMITSRDAA
jgi:transcription-repair coupling factor (superfamily II helicase)